MPDRLLKLIAYSSSCILICAVIVSIYLTNSNRVNSQEILDHMDIAIEVSSIYPTNIDANTKEVKEISIYSDGRDITNQSKIEKKSVGDNYIEIPLSKNEKGIVIEEDYRTRRIKIRFQSTHDSNFDVNQIKHVTNQTKVNKFEQLNKKQDSNYTYYSTSKDTDIESVFANDINYINGTNDIYRSDNSVSIRLLKTLERSGSNYELIMQFEKIYAPQVYLGEDGLYISLRKPSEVYDKIVVIDAGHGGKDSGAVGINENYLEKNLNLIIVEKMRRLLDDEDIKVYYTRIDDNTMYLLPRVNFANEVKADLFLSIHFNASEHESASGSEVLYNEKDNNLYSSLDFAKKCLEEIVKVTKNINRGLVEGNEMLIVGNSNMPVALVEIGFLTNNKELSFVTRNSTQKAISIGLVNAIKDTLKEMDK